MSDRDEGPPVTAGQRRAAIGRRSLFAAAGGVGVAAMLGRPASALDGSPLVVGQVNVASAPTSLQAAPGTALSEPLLSVTAGDSPAIQGNTTSGRAIVGVAGPDSAAPRSVTVTAGLFGLGPASPPGGHLGAGVVGLAGARNEVTPSTRTVEPQIYDGRSAGVVGVGLGGAAGLLGHDPEGSGVAVMGIAGGVTRSATSLTWFDLGASVVGEHGNDDGIGVVGLAGARSGGNVTITATTAGVYGRSAETIPPGFLGGGVVGLAAPGPGWGVSVTATADFGLDRPVGVIGLHPEPTGIGVVGLAGASAMPPAVTLTAAGVYGLGPDAAAGTTPMLNAGLVGLAGAAGGGPGVTHTVPGLYGVAGIGGTGATGVLAVGDVALDARGAVRVSTGGVVTLPPAVTSLAVAAPSIGPDTIVVPTITSNPGGRRIRWVEHRPGVGFVLMVTSGKLAFEVRWVAFDVPRLASSGTA